MYTVKGIDAWALLIIIGIGASGNHVPTLTEQFHAEGLHIEVVLLILPITMVGDVDYTVFLHCLNDGLKVLLTRRHVFQNDAVFDTLAVCQGIAYAESVVEPGAESVFADVILILNVITVLATPLIGDIDTKHIPNNTTPVVEGTFGNIHTSADIIAKP